MSYHLQRHGITCSYLSPTAETSEADRQLPRATHQRGPSTSSSAGFSMGSPEPDACGSVSSRSLISSDIESMDWFMSLATPSTPTLHDLGKDLFSLPTDELAPQVSQASTPLHISLPECPWTENYPRASEVGIAPQASRTHEDPVSSVRGLEIVDPMLQVITTAVPGLIPVNGPEAPVALQREQDGGLTPQSSASLALNLSSNGYTDKEARGHAYHAARRQLLFPALTQLEKDAERSRPRFDPCVSLLIALFSRAKVDEAARQTAAEAISFIMSQECQRSLPAAWWSPGLGQHTARDIGWGDLHIQSLIRRVAASVKLYLEQREVLAAVNFFQPSSRSQAIAVGRCVVVTLAAWGSLLKPDQRNPESAELIALMVEAHDSLNAEPDSVDKFLAIVAVLQLVHKLGMKHLPKLLATAVSIIQALSLHSAAALQSLCAGSPGLAARVKRACWIVFCVDKVNALRWKSFSLLPDSCLQYTPPPVEDCNSSQDWLLAQCRYSKLCAKIYNTTSHALEDQSRSSESKASIAAELEDWYKSVPDDGRLDDKTPKSSSLAKRLAICMFYQYCEAKLALLDVDGTCVETTEEPPLRSAVIALSRDIFKFSNRIEPDDIVYDRILLFLPSICLCKTATQVSTHGTAGFEDARAVLAVAHGFFARMSSVLPTVDFFDRVTELVDIAVRAHKSVV